MRRLERREAMIPVVAVTASSAWRMIPKKLAPAKAGVADFSDKIMRKIKENRERCRFNLKT
jgi:hypothetical protein